MARLAGKTALITGAASGMGAAHARLFVEEGARVIITDINSDLGRRHADQLGDNAIFLSHDVSDPDSWQSVVSEGEAEFGPITVLVNNAGITGPRVDTMDLEPADYVRLIDVDQSGVFYGMRAVLPGMIDSGGGSIVNISSAAGMAHLRGTPNVAYTSAKFAVRGMTKATAVEYGPHNVRVNSVHPGAVRTPLSATFQDKPGPDPIESLIPLRRRGTPEEVSYAVLFLASDEASYITGTELVVDGGRLSG